MASQMLGVSLQARRGTTQVMLGLSLRTRWDTGQVRHNSSKCNLMKKISMYIVKMVNVFKCIR